MGGLELTMVAIDTDRVRGAASGLRDITSEPRDIATTMRTDAMEGELVADAAGTIRLFGEIEHEIGLLSEVYDARADLAIGADAFPSYEAYMAFQQAAFDRLGAAITTLGGSLTNGIGDSAAPFDFFGELSEDAARELLEFLDGVGDEFAEEFAKLIETGKVVAGAIPEVLFALRLFKLIRGKVPVITNGLLFKLLLGLVPEGSVIVHLVTQLGKVIRVGGGVAALLSFLVKGWDVAKQGWPWDAFEASGHDYIADLGELGFYGTLAVLLLFPATIEVTGPLAAAFALLWATARYWDEITAPGEIVINEISDRVADAWDDAIDGAGDIRDFGEDAWDAASGTAADIFDDVTDWTADRVDDVRDVGRDVIDAVGDGVMVIHDAGETVLDTVDDAADRVIDIFEPDLHGSVRRSGPPQ